MADSERLERTGRAQVALLNIFGSLLIGLGIALLGKAVGKLLF